MHKKYLLGYDLGSSSLKAALLEAQSGQLIASAMSPEVEMTIESPQIGWAEQNPEIWWQNLKIATQKLLKQAQIAPQDILAIGISYQMHGLVIVDKNQNVLRPAIIWCDSRAVNIGETAWQGLGKDYCLAHLLNSPGNFTASNLKWVQVNEPQIYAQIHQLMLPGDYLAMRMTGEITTTISGLSEGIFWDYSQQTLAKGLLDFYQIQADLCPSIVSNFSNQGVLKANIAAELGLAAGTPITYRAGDQPNNAFSLNVLQPGETATTAGTSGVIYGVVDKPTADLGSRVNTFVHVNHQSTKPRYGVLLCVNGTGILNSWLRKNLSWQNNQFSYEQLNQMAQAVSIGSEGLQVLPFGNGNERMLQNRAVGASFEGLDFNRHHQAHLARAVQEGIVFALGYGFEIFKQNGLHTQVIRAGKANMFLSPLFREAFVNVIGCKLELYDTDGAQGAARGAGVGIGFYTDFAQAFQSLKCLEALEPQTWQQTAYQEAFQKWLAALQRHL
ncbi:MAG: FGGY family carbohydrate kinase [Microscillaceae bacterium]|nr:FGGY family carbohydrate kinase [Microscillaceae bacterium]